MAEDSAVEKYAEVDVNIGNIINKFEIMEKLDEGAFGQVFIVKQLETGKRFAMKIEAKRLDGGPASIKAEIEVMTHLKSNEAKYFPRLVAAGKERMFHWMAMDLLGDSLKKLRQKCPDVTTTKSGTWSRIGIQCLFVLKQIHDSGFLHRDLKPANFSLGPSDEILHSRILYLLDFGIARKFVVKKSSAKAKITKNPADFEFRLARRYVRTFKGTLIYGSPNAHAHLELGRGDDVWSLMYMVAELIKPLPWEFLDEPELRKKKISCRLKDLFNGYDVFEPVESMLNNCNYYQCPDYHMVYKALKHVYDESHVAWTDPYDWETAQMPSYKRWRAVAAQRTKVFVWENPHEIGDNLKRDPWKSLQKENFNPSKEVLDSVDEAENKKPAKGKKKKRNGDTVTCETVTTTTCEEQVPAHFFVQRKSMVKMRNPQVAPEKAEKTPFVKTPEKTARTPTARTPTAKSPTTARIPMTKNK